MRPAHSLPPPAGEKVPATFVGHSMAITFDMGSCTFDDHKWLHGGEKVGRRVGWWGGWGGGRLGWAARKRCALCVHDSAPCAVRFMCRLTPPARPLLPQPQELDCVEPSISYVKSPANFTSKYHSAPR